PDAAGRDVEFTVAVHVTDVNTVDREATRGREGRGLDVTAVRIGQADDDSRWVADRRHVHEAVIVEVAVGDGARQCASVECVHREPTRMRFHVRSPFGIGLRSTKSPSVPARRPCAGSWLWPMRAPHDRFRLWYSVLKIHRGSGPGAVTGCNCQ